MCKLASHSSPFSMIMSHVKYQHISQFKKMGILSGNIFKWIFINYAGAHFIERLTENKSVLHIFSPNSQVVGVVQIYFIQVLLLENYNQVFF
jgi:hypothetical protein